MKLIALTGGIGSGKSVVSRMLQVMGYQVYDCDSRAKQLMTDDETVRGQLIVEFGTETYLADGTLNRQHLSTVAFSNDEARARLNAIVHPAVGLDIMKRKPDFVESAILYESGLDILCDRIIVIDAPEEIRIARTIARDYHGDASPANIDKVRARIKAQNIPTGDLFINNDGKTSIADLAVKILNWLKKSEINLHIS